MAEVVSYDSSVLVSGSELVTQTFLGCYGELRSREEWIVDAVQL